MILWTVEGAHYENGRDYPSVSHFEWFAVKPDAEAFIRSKDWDGEPTLLKQHVPVLKAGLVRFLNHFAGN